MQFKDGLTVNGEFYQHPMVAYYQDKENFVEKSTEGSKAVEFYNGKRIFLTGGTGFLGKLVMEKLLRMCPETEVYMLCRPKRGKDVYQRLEDLFNDAVLSRLKEKDPKFTHRIIPIIGDITTSGLGISKEDREMLISKVDIIIHLAATVRFTGPLKDAILTNVRGTKDVVDLAKECKNLVVFAHVSTAYTHVDRVDPVDEHFHEPITQPYELIEMATTKSNEELEEFWKEISTNNVIANNYIYTKASAEKIIEMECQDLPAILFRPGIVVTTLEEPIPGYTDNIYGPAGIVIGAGAGALRVIYCDGKVTANMVPGDYTINSLLIAIYNRHLEKTPKIPIYNFVASKKNAIDWEKFGYLYKNYGIQIPVHGCAWCYSLTYSKSYLIYLLLVVFLHFIPAAIVDGFCIVTGQKPKMMKIYKKVHKLTGALTHFMINTYNFSNDEVMELWRNTSEVDQRLFPFNMDTLDWRKHSQRAILGLRTHMMNEGFETLPQAKKKFKRFYIIHNILYYVCVFLGLRLLFGILSTIFGLLNL